LSSLSDCSIRASYGVVRIGRVRFSQHVHREGRRDSSSGPVLEEAAAAVSLQQEQEQVLLSLLLQQHTATRSIKRQPTQLVDLDEQDHIIRLTHGAMTSRHRSSWLDDDVIWSAMAEIHLELLLLLLLLWMLFDNSLLILIIRASSRGGVVRVDSNGPVY
jgi:hypothetical protein